MIVLKIKKMSHKIFKFIYQIEYPLNFKYLKKNRDLKHFVSNNFFTVNKNINRNKKLGSL